MTPQVKFIMYLILVGLCIYGLAVFLHNAEAERELTRNMKKAKTHDWVQEMKDSENESIRKTKEMGGKSYYIHESGDTIYMIVKEGPK